MLATQKLDKTTRTGISYSRPREIYILVMGLTGAGKSTFISIVTENKDIPIGKASEMEGVTQEVQDYVLLYQRNGKAYEIHLIDSPGFDDGTLDDTQVLRAIAAYVNTNYKLKKRLAGVLYLHDITKGKFGTVGVQNVRLLEKMIGLERCNNCTVVTTKWGSDRQAEEQREATVGQNEKYFGTMLNTGEHTANMRRFDPNTKETALDIILPYLKTKFTPLITEQMVSPEGPKLTLGETEAGKVVSDNLRELLERNDKLAPEVQAARAILSRKFDERLFEEFKQKRKELRRQIRLQRSGRWIMRMTIVGSAIVATVLTAGPGATVFALEPMYENAVSNQRRKEKLAKDNLEKEFTKKSQDGTYLKTFSAGWLWDSKVNNLEDLRDEGYSIWSRSSEDMLQALNAGGIVGFAADEGESEEFEGTVETNMSTDSEDESDMETK